MDMSPKFTASATDEHPGGVFDVTFEGDGWQARGWVPAHIPVTVVVVDGEREACRGSADEDLGVRLAAGHRAFRFAFAVPEDGVDQYRAYVEDTAAEVPRLRDADD